MAQEQSTHKMQYDLLEKIKHRVGSDPKFREEFFTNPEQALKKSDLSPQAEALTKAMRVPNGGHCTWTCSWTD